MGKERKSPGKTDVQKLYTYNECELSVIRNAALPPFHIVEIECPSSPSFFAPVSRTSPDSSCVTPPFPLSSIRIRRRYLHTAGSSGMATRKHGGARRGEDWSNRGGVGRGALDRGKKEGEGGSSGPFSERGRRGEQRQRRDG